MSLVTVSQRVAEFIPLAKTKVRELTVELRVNHFNYNGYNSDTEAELLLQICETNDVVKLLCQSAYGGATDKQVNDIIDFYNKWLELHKVIPAQYQDDQMALQPEETVPAGTYATQQQLANEIAVRAAADAALNDRVTTLEGLFAGIGEIFPEGFFDNYDSTYTVVFDDDERLHTHDNKEVIDQFDEQDLERVKSLQNHFDSLGDPGGMHVNQEDRDRWDAASTPGETSVKMQYFTADGSTSLFVITNGNVDQLILVTVNGMPQTIGVDVSQVGNAVNFGTNLPNGTKVGVYYADGLTLVDGDTETYNLTSPSNITVGGLASGTALTGRSWQSILEEILVDYLLPQFTAFGSNDIPAFLEVGVAISGVKAFTWNISNPGNVQPNTVKIRDVTAAADLVTGLANDGAESVDIGSIPNTVPITRAWRAEATNTNAQNLQSAQKVLTSGYPYFFGKVASGGAAPGASRPAANQTLINGGTKVVAASMGTITVNFASTADDYIWFATPSGSTTKTVWFVDELNNGSIGGAVGPGGNLFPDPVVVSINSPGSLWSGVSFKIYISNYQTTAGAMQLRNA